MVIIYLSKYAKSEKLTVLTHLFAHVIYPLKTSENLWFLMLSGGMERKSFARLLYG